jgi:hypothetical protein
MKFLILSQIMKVLKKEELFATYDNQSYENYFTI